MTTTGDTRPVCPACGSAVTPALGACSWCGRPFDGAASSAATPETAAGSTAVLDGSSSASPSGGSRRGVPSAFRRRSRRFWIVGGAGAAVVVAAVVVVVLLTTGGGSGSTAPPDHRAQDARDVAGALSRLATDPSSLRASTQSLAGTDAAAAVPKGTTVAADVGSWQPDGAGGGLMTVRLTSPDGVTTSYLAVMVHENGGWKVLQTVASPGAAASASPTAVSS